MLGRVTNQVVERQLQRGAFVGLRGKAGVAGRGLRRGFLQVGVERGQVARIARLQDAEMLTW